MPFIYPNEIKALKEALKSQNLKRTLICFENELLHLMHSNRGDRMKSLNEAISEHEFVDFKNEAARKTWLQSSKGNQHIVLHDDDSYHLTVYGMEFQSLIYITPICLKCGDEGDKKSIIITRAKASLVFAKFEKQNCCRFTSYPNIRWNMNRRKWELNEGITLNQLREESLQIFEKTSKLKAYPGMV